MVIACSGQFSAPMRACASSAPSTCSSSTIAVPELVGAEHIGREHVATTVTDAEVGIDAHCHHAAERIRGSFARRTRYAPRRARIAMDGLRTGRQRRGRRGGVLGRAATPREPPNRRAKPAPAPPTYRLDSTLRLNQIQVLGSHNSYHGAPYPQILAELRENNLGAIADGLDYGHRPLPAQFDLGVRQIELDVYADPHGRQVRASAGARAARHTRARPGRSCASPDSR